MPCPDGFTERQCKLRDHIAKRIEAKGENVNAWAVATAMVKERKARKQS